MGTWVGWCGLIARFWTAPAHGCLRRPPRPSRTGAAAYAPRVDQPHYRPRVSSRRRLAPVLDRGRSPSPGRRLPQAVMTRGQLNIGRERRRRWCNPSEGSRYRSAAARSTRVPRRSQWRWRELNPRPEYPVAVLLRAQSALGCRERRLANKLLTVTPLHRHDLRRWATGGSPSLIGYALVRTLRRGLVGRLSQRESEIAALGNYWVQRLIYESALRLSARFFCPVDAQSKPVTPWRPCPREVRSVGEEGLEPSTFRVSGGRC